MKNLLFAATLAFFGAFAFAAASTSQTAKPQKLTDTEMATVIGGSCVSITCETWVICGNDICGFNCEVEPCEQEIE